MRSLLAQAVPGLSRSASCTQLIALVDPDRKGKVWFALSRNQRTRALKLFPPHYILLTQAVKNNLIYDFQEATLALLEAASELALIQKNIGKIEFTRELKRCQQNPKDIKEYLELVQAYSECDLEEISALGILALKKLTRPSYTPVREALSTLTDITPNQIDNLTKHATCIPATPKKGRGQRLDCRRKDSKLLYNLRTLCSAMRSSAPKFIYGDKIKRSNFIKSPALPRGEPFCPLPSTWCLLKTCKLMQQLLPTHLNGLLTRLTPILNRR